MLQGGVVRLDSVIVIGGGSLGTALVRGLQSSSILMRDQIGVVDVNESRRTVIRDAFGTMVWARIPEMTASTCVVLAVKPSEAESVCVDLRARIHDQQVVLSCMAGVSIATLRGYLSGHSRVARCMPNVAAGLKRSISGFYVDPCIDSEDVAFIKSILDAVGQSLQLASEDKLHMVTAISGSGPGYLALCAEAMVRAGEQHGLSRTESLTLVAHTFLGLGEMLVRGEFPPEDIRRFVTSPHGTTAAAVAVLEQGGVAESFVAAIEAAYQRSRGLAGEA